MIETPNLDEINKLEQDLFEEYNLDSRLSRYESMSPELIEFAKTMGVEDTTVASHALFIADFVVTSSEVPAILSDDDRRTIILQIYKNLLPKVDDPVTITKLFYIAYNLGTKIRRTDSFLAGRGIEQMERAMIILLLYLIPFIMKTQDMIDDEGCYTELGIFMAAINHSNPNDELDSVPVELTFGEPEFLIIAKQKLDAFLHSHNAEVNDTVVLPNINESQILYLTNEYDLPLVSKYNIDAKITERSLEESKELFDFIQAESEFQLMYMRGRIHEGNGNIIMIIDPEDQNSLVLMKTPADEVNVTEFMALMQLEKYIDKGWMAEHLADPIGEQYTETVEVEEEDWVDKEIEEEVEVEVQVKVNTKKESKGLWSKIKSFFGGSNDKAKASDNDAGDDTEAEEPVYETRIEKQKVKKTIQEKVVRTVEKEVVRVDKIGINIPSYLAKSLGIISLSDLRLFEMFDTYRESEYEISGSLISNFKENKTTFFGTKKLGDPSSIASILDGLDEVVEKVVGHYFDENIQIIPTEILFRGPEDTRFIISLDGTADHIVGTIAQTHQEDFSNWQDRGEPADILQRRTLHMRTNQLMSSLNHTPFDRSAERIYKFDMGQIETIELEHAILKLD